MEQHASGVVSFAASQVPALWNRTVPAQRGLTRTGRHAGLPQHAAQTKVYTTHFYYGWSFDLMAYDPSLKEALSVFLDWSLWLFCDCAYPRTCWEGIFRRCPDLSRLRLGISIASHPLS